MTILMFAFRRIYPLFLLLGCLLLTCGKAFSQLNIGSLVNQKDTVNEDSIYAHKEIPSAAMAQKKFNLKRRLYQNLVTHYNFYFNAKSKLQEALQTVTGAHQDNFRELLSFYPYTLPEMSLVKNDLDSVIFKASVGIEVHDPRVKWMPDLYLLAGKAYYYEQDFTNAERAFQYVNLAYAPVQKGDYNAIIGTRSENRESQITISTPEKQTGFLHKLKHLPSRNEALIWLARTYMAEQEYDKAQSLLNDLAVDPDFPERLKGELSATQAYFYYVQERYKETIPYLDSAVALQDDKLLKARWEYILGQLYWRDQQITDAVKHFKIAAGYTANPLLSFFATFNIARININAGNGSLQDNIALLLKMARKDKYERYRDVIYYGLAELEINNKDTATAENDLLKSISNAGNDPVQKASAADRLANLYYDQQNYAPAREFYDTTAQFMGTGFPDSANVARRKSILGDVIQQVAVIDRQDSLQKLAFLPENLREAAVKAMADAEEKQVKEKERQQRKAQQLMPGMNNNELLTANEMNMPGNEENTAGAGSWYFYNPDIKSAGYTAFRQKWGDRPLVDDWRRSAVIKGFTANTSVSEEDTTTAKKVAPAHSTNYSGLVDALMANIPLTPQKLKQSNDSIIQAYFNLGNMEYLQLNDMPAAIRDFETLLNKYPQNNLREQVYYFLYLLYQKTNQPGLADKYRLIILKEYPQSTFASVIQYGPAANPDSLLREKTMHYYDTAYEHYVTGNDSLALQEVVAADSLFPQNYLQPRFDLLHGMILVHQGNENEGVKVLQGLIEHYPSDSAGSAAREILKVLANKQQIVAHLTSLTFDTTSNNNPSPPAANNSYSQPVNKPVAVNITPITPINQHAKNEKVGLEADSTTLHLRPQKIIPPKPITPYALNEKDPHFVIMLFKRTDKQVIETSNNRFAQYLKTHPGDSAYTVSPYAITPDQTMLVFRLFKNEDAALNFLDQVRNDASAVMHGIPQDEYSFYIISRDNFIMLNQTKDLEGYIKFFNDNYVTQ